MRCLDKDCDFSLKKLVHQLGTQALFTTAGPTAWQQKNESVGPSTRKVSGRPANRCELQRPVICLPGQARSHMSLNEKRTKTLEEYSF